MIGRGGAPSESGRGNRPEPQSLRQRLPKIAEIRGKIEKRFGPTFDEASGQITNRSFDEINLVGNCGEVSRITGRVVGGDVKQKYAYGHDSTMFFQNDDGDLIEIASGHTESVHSYVVDNNDMVWDPITQVWGTMSEVDFLERIVEE